MSDTSVIVFLPPPPPNLFSLNVVYWKRVITPSFLQHICSGELEGEGGGGHFPRGTRLKSEIPIAGDMCHQQVSFDFIGKSQRPLSRILTVDQYEKETSPHKGKKLSELYLTIWQGGQFSYKAVVCAKPCSITSSLKAFKGTARLYVSINELNKVAPEVSLRI